MSLLLSAFWSALELLSFHFFQGAFLTIRVSRKRYTLTFLAAWLFSVIYVNLFQDAIVKLCLAVSMLIIINCLNYQGNIVRKILFAILVIVIGSLIDTLILYGAGAVLGISVSDLIWRKLTYCVIATLAKLISVLLSWVISKIRMNDSQEPIHQKWLLLILLFPTVSLIAILIVFRGYQSSEDLSTSAVYLSVIFAIANVAILYLIHLLEKHTSETKALALMNQQKELQTDSIQALEKSYRAQRKAIHEHRSQLQTICDLLENQEYNAAQAYIKQLQQVQTTRVFAINSHHPIIDAVLNHKYQLAQEKGISFEAQVNDLAQLTLGTDTLVVLLSNLLDNAIEACARVETSKEIRFTILLEEKLFLSIRNTSMPVEIVDNIIATTKKNKQNHGYGLQQVRYILDKQNAEYSFSYEDGWFHFVAEISVP